MKILVLVKEVLDVESALVLHDENSVKGNCARYVINPYDELALEEALRLREKYKGEVIVISLGRAEAENSVRNALALGADRASLIICARRDAALVSKALAERIQQEREYDIVLSGWIATDDNKAEVPGRVSGILGIPFVNVVTKLDIFDKLAVCEREGDGVLERVEVPLPALIAVAKGINQPRLPTVMNILLAGKMPLQKITVPEISLPNEEAVSYKLAAKERKGIIVKSVNSDEAAAFLIKVMINEKVL